MTRQIPKYDLKKPNGFLFKHGSPFIGQDGLIYYTRPSNRRDFERAVYFGTRAVCERIRDEFFLQMRSFDRFRPQSQNISPQRRSIQCDMGYDDISFEVGGPFEGKSIIKPENFWTVSQAIVAFNFAGVFLEQLFFQQFKAPSIQKNKGYVEFVYPLPESLSGITGFPKESTLNLKRMFNDKIARISASKGSNKYIHSIEGNKGVVLRFEGDAVIGRCMEINMIDCGAGLTFVISQAVDAMIEFFN
ncbi:hypothetical protein KO465_03970 [Candidatus Micrarchaeota archaeon]|nr:hypothetical protein [Candidatus Micrarchaeota archaeon]